jgi:hypothetical protein
MMPVNSTVKRVAGASHAFSMIFERSDKEFKQKREHRKDERCKLLKLALQKAALQQTKSRASAMRHEETCA